MKNQNNRKYKTIVADPPWSYRQKATGIKFRSGSASKYLTMTTEDICNLNIIPKIRHDNSVLFLWATVPLLEDAFVVMREWGYNYKTAVFWRKIMSLGMGYWFRGQIEMCLLGVRGNVKAFRCQKSNFLQSKVRKHSQKPEEFFSLINDIVPHPRIELFARQRREGWDAWGNELSNDIQRNLVKFNGK